MDGLLEGSHPKRGMRFTSFGVREGLCLHRCSDSPRVDGYLFAYGLDFKSAIKAFYKISGPQPLIPRWALGNWWSRYYKYTSEAYLELMDRFKEEKIPFSVGVLDMDVSVSGPSLIEQHLCAVQSLRMCSPPD